jgi:hypothetical protein
MTTKTENIERGLVIRPCDCGCNEPDQFTVDHLATGLGIITHLTRAGAERGRGMLLEITDWTQSPRKIMLTCPNLDARIGDIGKVLAEDEGDTLAVLAVEQARGDDRPVRERRVVGIYIPSRRR